jgi:FecR protein
MRRLPVAIVLTFLAQFACAQGNPAAPAAADRTVAGTVSIVEGDVRFFDSNERERRPNPRDPIYEGDSIVTGGDGEVHLDMEDGGYIGVRPNTKMRIASFKAEGGTDDGFLIGLLEGSFRAVTGWITRNGNAKAEVRTPTATIGIRGTDYEPLVIPEGGTAGEPGTYNRVYIGETEMRTPQGSVVVKPNQAGFVPRAGAPRPRVLDRIPAFFRPTRNEKRFEGLHQHIHQHLEERRQQRIRQIEQRRRERAGKAVQRSRQPFSGEGQTKPGLEQRREQALKQAHRQEAQKQPRRAEAQKQAEERRRNIEERRRNFQERRQAHREPGKAELEERRRRQFEKRE